MPEIREKSHLAHALLIVSWSKMRFNPTSASSRGVSVNFTATLRNTFVLEGFHSRDKTVRQVTIVCSKTSIIHRKNFQSFLYSVVFRHGIKNVYDVFCHKYSRILLVSKNLSSVCRIRNHVFGAWSLDEFSVVGAVCKQYLTLCPVLWQCSLNMHEGQSFS